MFRDEMFADFTAFWLIAHATRFGAQDAAPSDCPLEQWREAGLKQGVEARKDLYANVATALEELGQGIVTANPDLRDQLERIVKERVGQGYFRRALLDFWAGRCPVTGISDEPLLRASHIVPWAHCHTDEQRLDVFNGLLLAAHWDAAFDRGLVSFDDDGRALFKPELSAAARELLAPDHASSVPLEESHRRSLTWHRSHFGFEV